MNSKKFKFIIEKTGTGYSTFEIKLPVFTSGQTMLELQQNSLEALILYFEDEYKKT